MQTSNDPSISNASAIELLPDVLLQDHLLALFPKMGYDPVQGDARASDPNDVIPLFFTKGPILLFPPSTDNPKKSLLRGIVGNVSRVLEAHKDALNNKKLLLFPIYEEWNVAFRPRKSWVLGVYVVAEQQFYLLDSTGPNRASFYSSNLQDLNNDLTVALAFTNTPIKPLKPSYLNLQPRGDAISSGHWIAYFIEKFASGMSLQDILNLPTQTPLTKIDAVKARLTRVYQHIESVQESPQDEDASHSCEDTPLDISAVIEQQERQDYGRPSQQNPEDVRSFLHCGIPTQKSQSEGLQSRPISGDGFKFDFYFKLIFAGTLTSIIALLCLASAAPVISATVSSGLLAVGVTLFAAGILGRCGLFAGNFASHREGHHHRLTEGFTP